MLNYHRRNNSRRDLTPFIPVIQTTNLGINALLTTVKTPLAVIPQLMGVNYGHLKIRSFHYSAREKQLFASPSRSWHRDAISEGA
jgi:hypothetical protein